MNVRQSFVAEESISLNIPSDIVRRYIQTPERILDYYPGGRECGRVDQEGYFYCRGDNGISLLQVTEDKPDYVALRVWTSTSCQQPYTVAALQARAFFVMDEGWILRANGQRTELIRTWGNLHKIRLRFLPIAWMIRRTVGEESQQIAHRWEQQARSEVGGEPIPGIAPSRH